MVVEQRRSPGGFSDVVHLLRNRLESTNHWIGVRLRELNSGQSPFGAKVTVRAGGKNRVAHVVSGDSFASQHAPVAHFGLGDVRKVESIEVEYIGGGRRRIEAPKIDRYHVVQ